MIDAEASVIILVASRLTVGTRLSMGTNAYLGPPPHSNVAFNLERRASMTWAQRLKRVSNIDIETYSECH